MKREWFERLERLATVGQQLPDSNLDCLTHCVAMCCPRLPMRAMDQQRIASPVVVLLPFEMEYMIEKLGVSPAIFRVWPVEMADGLYGNIGLLDLSKPCPFLQPDFRCGIYENRPLDCRTFPLLPYLTQAGQLAWEYGQNCPSLERLNPAFTAQMKEIWADLFPALPADWWRLYRQADDWTGWAQMGDDTVIAQAVGPNETRIRPVVGRHSPHLPTVIELFRQIFPDDAHYIPYVETCAWQSSASHPATFDHVWLVEQQGRPIGLRVFSYIHTRRFGHGAFIGLLPPYRSQGIGRWLVAQTHRQLQLDARAFGHSEATGYCVEVAPPPNGGGDLTGSAHLSGLEDQRRLAFHQQCGSIKLDVDYVEPPMIAGVDYIMPEQLTGVKPQPMQLRFYPARPRSSLSQVEIFDIIEGLYLDVYRLAPDSWYVQRAIRSI